MLFIHILKHTGMSKILAIILFFTLWLRHFCVRVILVNRWIEKKPKKIQSHITQCICFTPNFVYWYNVITTCTSQHAMYWSQVISDQCITKTTCNLETFYCAMCILYLYRVQIIKNRACISVLFHFQMHNTQHFLQSGLSGGVEWSNTIQKKLIRGNKPAPKDEPSMCGFLMLIKLSKNIMN